MRPDKGQRSREEEEVSQSVYEGGKQQHSTAHCASESPDSKVEIKNNSNFAKISGGHDRLS